MTKTQLIRLVKTKFSYYKEDHSNIIVHCCFCKMRRGKPDVKMKLSINWEKEVYQCWLCNKSGRVADLFNTLQFTMHSWKPLKDPETKISEQGIEKIPENAVYFADLDKNHPAQEYIRGRGLTSLPPETLFCDEFFRNNYSFGPRIVFPIIIDKEYKGFQARAIQKHPAKYINSIGLKKSHCFYNWDRGKIAKKLFVVEGIFDALKFFPEYIAICSFGKVLSQIQLSMLLTGNFEEIYICYDPDAKKEMKKMAKSLSLYRSHVYYINIPSPWEDAGDMPKEELFKLIRKGINYGSSIGIQTIY